MIAQLPTRERWAKWYGADVDDAEMVRADRLWLDHVGGLRASPEASVRWLMDELMPRSMRREPVTQWPAVALRSTAATDISWVRELHDYEREFRYVHGFDKNAQYLTACSSVELGLGGLECRTDVLFDAALPGYWRHAHGWLTTPAYRTLVDGGEAAEMATVAHVWTNHGRALRYWYERLRDARAAFVADTSPAAALALACLKRGYTRAIGWLDGGWYYQREETHSPAFRPDWRHAIVSQAAANLQRTIDRCQGRVAAVHIDCLYVVSDSPYPNIAAPEAILLGSGLGQFKVRASCHLAHVVDCFRAGASAGALDMAVRACPL